MMMNNTNPAEQTAGRPGRKSTACEGNIFYLLRVTNGMTMDQLAELANTNKNRISRLEHGQNVQNKVIQAVAQLFGVSIDDLVRNNIAAVATAKHIGSHSTKAAGQKQRMIAQINIGDLGEEIAASIERDLLKGTGYETRVSTHPARNRRNGYDVISATRGGRDKYIEVKTSTSADPDESFHMSDAEFRRMKEFQQTGAIYRLYRIYDLNAATMEYKFNVYTPQEIIDQFEPRVESYLMVKKEVQEA